jgi:hypothetical protein
LSVRQSEDTSSESQLSVCELDEVTLGAITYVSRYMGDCDDWVDIKIEIMNNLRPELRRRFSRRDQSTREQVPNDFDLAVMREYQRASGITPVVRTLAQRKALRSGLENE